MPKPVDQILLLDELSTSQIEFVKSFVDQSSHAIEVRNDSSAIGGLPLMAIHWAMIETIENTGSALLSHAQLTGLVAQAIVDHGLSARNGETAEQYGLRALAALQQDIDDMERLRCSSLSKHK